MTIDLDDSPLHHVCFTQARASQRGSQILVPSHWNGNLRAYGELIPGTVVALPGGGSSADVAVPLDPSLEALVLPGFETNNVIKRGVSYARIRPVIRQLVQRARFVQIQHVSSFGFLAGLFAIALNKPFYLDMGGTLRDPPGVKVPRSLPSRLARIWYRRAEARLARHARLLIATSAHLHETFPPTSAGKAVITHSMVEKKCIHRRDNACAGDPIKLFVATRMIHSKGIQHLIQAVKQLLAESYNVQLQVAGVGDYLDTLKRLTTESGMDSHIEFLGGIPGGGEQLWAYYRSADIAVLPSMGHYEGTPRMIIEAWAAGAPVVSTRVGGIPISVKHGEEALLVTPGSAPELVQAIKEVYKNSELRTRLVSNAYQRVETMTYEGRLPLIRQAFREYLPGLLPED